jgi:nitroreductase
MIRITLLALASSASALQMPWTAPATKPWVSRRSVAKYDTDRAVATEVVGAALDAAVLAPCHFLTEPWRFYQAGPETKAKLCALNPEKAKMFEGVPEWMIVTVAASEYGADGSISTKKGLEDHAAVSCAIQNFMVSLANDGVGSKWMTGALGVAPEAVMDVVGADKEAERFMGAIWFGYPAKDLEEASPPKRKLGMQMHKVLA